MRKAFLVLAAVAMMALCVPGTVLAQDNADFDITARLGSPMTLTLDVAEIGFGTLSYGAVHAAISALNEIVVTVTGDDSALFDVMFDGNITPAATNYPVTMAGPGAETFIVNIQHDSTGDLAAAPPTTQEIFNISAIIPANALGLMTIPGAYAPAVPVNIRVDYQ